MPPARRKAAAPPQTSWRDVTPQPLVLASGSDEYILQRIKDSLRDQTREQRG